MPALSSATPHYNFVSLIGLFLAFSLAAWYFACFRVLFGVVLFQVEHRLPVAFSLFVFFFTLFSLLSLLYDILKQYLSCFLVVLKKKLLVFILTQCRNAVRWPCSFPPENAGSSIATFSSIGLHEKLNGKTDGRTVVPWRHNQSQDFWHRWVT